MKKIRLFWALALFILSSLPVQAKHVNVEKAEKAARSYAHTTLRLTTRKNFHLSHTISRPVKRNYSGLRNAQEEPVYYVFTMNGEGGFIIISGDDAVKPVLGYSDTGTFDESNPNLAYWMETLSREIAAAIENDLPQDAQTQAAWDALDNGRGLPSGASGDYVDPLVKTRWNQGAPYNKFCPEQRYTGCVATAMAQIMKYHEYPTTRTVTIPGYTTRTNNISVPAVTETTDYDWNNMLDTYTSTSGTEAQKDAVATLMYHCGVSVEMDYKASESGAYSMDVTSALTKYFGYDTEITYYRRDYYSDEHWINLLKTELKANRPVYYGGQGSAGGHAFVCDGYDTGGLFHFNWGWGGNSDGYFEVSALNPPALGAGGGSGGFNSDQDIITGIQPSTGNGGQPPIQLGLSAVSAGKSGNFISLTADSLMNIGNVTITDVYLGVLLCNQDNSYRSHETSKRTLGLGPRYLYLTLPLLTNYSLPSDLPVGTYKLYPAYSASEGIPDIIPGKNEYPYITVKLNADGNVVLSGDKESQSAPAIPEPDGKTAVSVTLKTIANAKYAKALSNTAPAIPGGNWQDSPAFSGLTPNTTYYFFAYYPETATHLASAASEGLEVTTEKAALGGQVTISGSAVFGGTLTAETSGLTSTPNAALGTLSFLWKREGEDISGATGKTYTLVQADIAKGISVTVTANNCLGSVSSAATSSVEKASQAAPAIPESDGKTAVSVTLKTIANAKYAKALSNTAPAIPGGDWQDSPAFSGLTLNTTYYFFAYYPETATHLASSACEGLEVTTEKAALGGQVTISGSAVFGETLTAEILGLTSTPNVALGTLSFLWKRGGEDISGATGKTYTLVQADIAKGISVTVTANNCSGSVSSAATSLVGKASQAAPAIPVPDGKTAVSVTLKTIANAKYAKALSNTAPAIPGGDWQDSPAFSGLTPNTTYYFFAYYPETATHLASSASEGLEVTTEKAALGGQVTISGSAVFGETLTAETSGLTSTSNVALGTLSFLWKRGGEDISGATGNTYTLIQADIANGISVTVTANNCLGSVSSAVTSPVEKASQAAPAAPVAESITATSITLAAITGAQYSVDRGPWQDSPVFNDLSPDTEYTFHAKLKESETHKESPASQAVISTNPAETAIPAVKDESTIELYPNPFTDKLYLKGAKGCTLRIYTPGGILVHIREVTASDEIVPLKHLRTGIYLFRLDKEGKTKTIWGIKSR